MKTPRRQSAIRNASDHSSRVAAAVLAGLVLAAYANIVFSGETLVATSNYHPFDYRFDRLRTGNVAPPALTNWHDEGSAWWQWEPAAKFFHAAIRKGRFPLWDPTIAGGIDAHVNATQGQYFPPHVVLLLAGDTPALRDLYSLLLVWISGACCLLLLRRRGFHWLSALFFGVSYSLGGSMTFNLNTILGQTCAMIPVLLLAVEELLDAPSRRRVAATAIAAGLLVLASFLPIVVSGLLLAGFRLLAEALAPREGVEPAERDRTVRRARRAGVAAGFAALLLGVALAAFLLLPVKLAGSRSKAFDSWYSGVGLHHYHAQDSLTLVSPIVSWDVWQVIDPAYQVFRKPDWYSSFFYVGLVPILLAVFAAPARVRAGRSLFLFLLGAAALLLLKLLGVPPVQWIGKLPVLRNIHFIPYFCGALAVAIGGLAALGVESLIRRPPGRWRVAAAAGLAAAVFAGIAWFAASHGFNPAASLRRWVVRGRPARCPRGSPSGRSRSASSGTPLRQRRRGAGRRAAGPGANTARVPSPFPAARRLDRSPGLCPIPPKRSESRPRPQRSRSCADRQRLPGVGTLGDLFPVHLQRAALRGPLPPVHSDVGDHLPDPDGAAAGPARRPGPSWSGIPGRVLADGRRRAPTPGRGPPVGSQGRSVRGLPEPDGLATGLPDFVVERRLRPRGRARGGGGSWSRRIASFSRGGRCSSPAAIRPARRGSAKSSRTEETT